MIETARHKDISNKSPRTAKELYHVLNANLSTLNRDIDPTRNMPALMPGRDPRHFTEPLRTSGFTNLAKAFDVVHNGELRKKRGKRFPSVAEAEQFQAFSEILKDLSHTVGNNLHLLDSYALIEN